jgi:hypothetical protein
MKSVIFTSNGFSYKSLKALKKQVDTLFGDVDLLIFAVHSEYDLAKVAENLSLIFERDDFIMFHAIEHFNGTSIIEDGISVCCMKFQKSAYVKYFYIEDLDVEDAIDKTAQYFNDNSDKFHMIFSGICDGNIGSIIEGISKKLQYTPIDNIVGGVSSGIEKEGTLQAFQYIDKRIVKNGFIILSFENMSAVIDVSLGFKAYGITYKITKAEGNRLYSVDDGKNFSYIASKMLFATDVKKDIRNLWYAPLSILSENDGYMLTLRTIEKITDDYVEFFAPVHKGEYFKLSFAIPEDLIQTDEETAKRLVEKIRKPECSFNFSCIARQYVLEDMQEKELEMYVENFQTGLFGFFTFGEIGPDKMYKCLKLYNETSLAVLMREE